jgi:hypothetical protein
MCFPSPILPQFPIDSRDEMAVVSLSNLADTLIVRIPDPHDIPPNWEVYPILGADPDEPEWRGEQQPAGIWDDAADDMIELTGIELEIAKADLAPYLGTQVELRYKFADESSLELCSELLLMRIEP